MRSMGCELRPRIPQVPPPEAQIAAGSSRWASSDAAQAAQAAVHCAVSADLVLHRLDDRRLLLVDDERGRRCGRLLHIGAGCVGCLIYCRQPDVLP
jgi:hypothetical protein